MNVQSDYTLMYDRLCFNIFERVFIMAKSKRPTRIKDVGTIYYDLKLPTPKSP